MLLFKDLTSHLTLREMVIELLRSVRLPKHEIDQNNTCANVSLGQLGALQQWSQGSVISSTQNAGVGHWSSITARRAVLHDEAESIVAARAEPSYLSREKMAHFGVCLLNSSLFYWFYRSVSTAVTSTTLRCEPCRFRSTGNARQLGGLSNDLTQSLTNNAERTYHLHIAKAINRVEQFTAQQSKPIIDEIDRVLARHYGFTDEELDFIINYDIKYRMGDELEAPDDSG